MNKLYVMPIAVSLLAFNLATVQAQSDSNSEREGMREGMDHSKMKHSAHANPEAKPKAMAGDVTMKQGSGQGAMQGGSAPPNARSPDYSDGYDFGDVPRPVLADEHNFGSLLVNRLESVKTSNNTSITYDAQAWFGRDYDRAVLKAEGDIDGGQLQDATTELLWGHAIATYWDTQLGVRYDSGVDPSRSWLAFGMQGLAPYWFEVDVAGYIGESGRVAASLEAEYELLLTQKLILQPRLEANWYGQSDPSRGLGSGLSNLNIGVRLRYEIQREFAPYIGVEWARKYGGTADFSTLAGNDASEARIVAGVRFWF